METLSDLARRQTVGKPLPAQGRAATIQRPPATDTDPVWVTFDTVSTTALRGPCVGWAPRGTVLPAVGDHAAVLVLDDGTLLIAAWWPA